MAVSDLPVFLEWLRSLSPSQALFLTGLLLVVLGAVGATGKIKGVSFAAGVRSLVIGIAFLVIGGFFLAVIPWAIQVVRADDDRPSPTPALVSVPPTIAPSQPQLSPKPPIVTLTTAAGPTFQGLWQTMDGGLTQISQSGNLVELQGSAPNGVSYMGRGQVDGRFATLDFANSVGVRGRLVLELVTNGSAINGQLQTFAGSMPFQMVRRG